LRPQPDVVAPSPLLPRVADIAAAAARRAVAALPLAGVDRRSVAIRFALAWATISLFDMGLFWSSSPVQS